MADVIGNYWAYVKYVGMATIGVYRAVNVVAV